MLQSVLVTQPVMMGLVNLITDNGAQFQECGERNYVDSIEESMQQYAFVLLRANIREVLELLSAPWGVFLMYCRRAQPSVGTRELLEPNLRSIQVYYASVFCHDNHCLYYLFLTRIYPSCLTLSFWSTTVVLGVSCISQVIRLPICNMGHRPR